MVKRERHWLLSEGWLAMMVACLSRLGVDDAGHVSNTFLPFRTTGVSEMAKGQQRSNREKKKPKQEKAKPAGAASSFAAAKTDFRTPPSSAKK
jgi:hypothetical protein